MLSPAAVVFDLDGTLVDSRGDIVAALNHALQGTNRQPLPAIAIVGLIGDGARALCARAAQLPEASPDVDNLVERFIAYYEEHPVDLSRWAPGAVQALEDLAEIAELRLAICTNKPRTTTEAVLGALGVRTRFAAIYGGGDGPERKPAPGPLLAVVERLGVAPNDVIMVGDGPQDIECARRAGARSVAVAAGFTPRSQLLAAKPDVMIDTLADLTGVIRRWRDATAKFAVKT
jgi:phosphoglycolate phosphatase